MNEHGKECDPSEDLGYYKGIEYLFADQEAFKKTWKKLLYDRLDPKKWKQFPQIDWDIVYAWSEA